MGPRFGAMASGSALILAGAAVIWITSGYPIGSAARMGAGYLPMACGIGLVLFGLMIAAFDREAVETGGLGQIVRPAVTVFAGLVAWALMAEPLGLVPATFVLVVLASFALPGARWPTILLTAAFLSGFGVFVFILGLNIRLDAFWF